MTNIAKTFNLQQVLSDYRPEDLAHGEYEFLDAAYDTFYGINNDYQVAVNTRSQIIEKLYSENVFFEDYHDFRNFLFENYEIGFNAYDKNSQLVLVEFVITIHKALAEKLSKKAYVPEGAQMFCDGCYLRFQDGKLVFDGLNYDGGLWYDGKSVTYDANKQAYYKGGDDE